MDALELLQCIERGEDSHNQFRKNATSPDLLAAEFIAFSNNSRGGHIFIGVDDDSEITGLTSEDIRRLNQMIGNVASQFIKDPINPETDNVEVGGKLVLVVTVHEGLNKPYMDNNGYMWIKSGSDKRKVTIKEEMRRIFQDSDLLQADEVPVTNTTINDIDQKYLEEFYRRRFEEDLPEDLPPMKLLENLNLAREGSLNLAGLLLLGKSPQLKKPAFVVKAVSFVGDDPATDKYRDSEDIDGNLRQMYERTLSFLTRNLKKVQGDQGFNTQGELEIPKFALEELLVNMLLHRDYFISAPWRVFLFDDRIELINPGHLPNTLTIEHIKHGNSNIRNPVIASFATHELPYRGIATGIRRALKAYPHIEFESNHDENYFKCVILRNQTEHKKRKTT